MYNISYLHNKKIWEKWLDNDNCPSILKCDLFSKTINCFVVSVYSTVFYLGIKYKEYFLHQSGENTNHLRHFSPCHMTVRVVKSMCTCCIYLMALSDRNNISLCRTTRCNRITVVSKYSILLLYFVNAFILNICGM